MTMTTHLFVDRLEGGREQRGARKRTDCHHSGLFKLSSRFVFPSSGPLYGSSSFMLGLGRMRAGRTAAPQSGAEVLGFLSQPSEVPIGNLGVSIPVYNLQHCSRCFMDTLPGYVYIGRYMACVMFWSAYLRHPPILPVL